jgi:hypothetical protein
LKVNDCCTIVEKQGGVNTGMAPGPFNGADPITDRPTSFSNDVAAKAVGRKFRQLTDKGDIGVDVNRPFGL